MLAPIINQPETLPFTHPPTRKKERTHAKKRRGGQVGKASCQPTSGLGGEEPKCARCTVPIQLTSAPFLSISAAPAVFVTDIPSFINHRKQLRDFVTSEQHTANSAHVQAWACKWLELKRSYRRKKKLYNFHFGYKKKPACQKKKKKVGGAGNLVEQKSVSTNGCFCEDVTTITVDLN